MAPTHPDPPSSVAWHRLLLRLAGRLPDDLISRARTWVAGGRQAEAARALTEAVVAGAVPVAEADAAVLEWTLRAAGEGTGALAHLSRTDDAPLPPFEMAPASAEVLSDHGDEIPTVLDLTGDYDGPAGPDAIDAAAVAAARREPAIMGLWRTWRFPAEDGPWSSPKRLYLVTVPTGFAREVGPQLLELTDRLQSALGAAGEISPQVEVCGDGDDLPAYQRLAWAYAALLWARPHRPPVQLARVFDAVDPLSGPAFAPAHPRLADPAERDRVAAYLRDGEILLHTTALIDDVVDPSRTGRVPMSFRTDGTWIWTDAVPYYLTEHLLAPDPDLLIHIRMNQFQPPAIDAVALHRAMVYLQQAWSEPAWAVGG